MAALPMVGGLGAGWPAWALGSAALGLPVVAAVLLARAARRDASAFRSLAQERDELAARLAETAGALGETTAAVTREQDARLDERAAVETAVVALSRKVQASAHRIQEEAARMVQRHATDPDVLQTSMRVDHAAAQHARQAQSLVALCGRRPGQTWDDPLPLPDVVRAAAGRITAFQRVEVSGEPGLAVSGRAVEALVHVVAELLANATQCSPPNTQVLATLRQVQRGAVIEIDDCGVGMEERELVRVRALANGTTSVTIADLGEVPQTGLAVVGTYARLLDLRVDLMESVYGGLRAVVLVPDTLVEVATTAPALLAPSADDAWSTPAPTLPPADAVAAPGGSPEHTTGSGSVAPDEPRPPGPPVLPQRRGRQTRGGDGLPGTLAARPTATRPAVRPSEQSAEEVGAWIGAFFAASADGTGPDRTLSTPEQTSEQQSLHDPQHDDPTLEAGATSEDR